MKGLPATGALKKTAPQNLASALTWDPLESF
jgi:hypothetical protein